MVSSSKKKRGKQRKAAKQKTSAGITCYTHPSNELSIISTQSDRTYILPHQHKLAALFVQRGDAATTVVMEELTDEDVLYDGISRPNISLVQSGILSSVLNFLKRCEHETFDGVMAGARGDVFAPNGTIISNIGGDMDTPSIWIRVLLKAVELEPSCMLQIVESIGPLIRCFINDIERLFFNNNKHWGKAIVEFVELIGRIVNPATPNWDSKIVDTLLQHEGFLPSIIQCCFWEDQRPDIANELGNEDCSYVVSLGRCIAEHLLRNATNQRIGDGSLIIDKNQVAAIGSIPIVSKEYDPSCMVSYTAGLIRQTKIEESENSMLAILVLMKEADCVDKGVIIEMMDFGINTKDFRTAELTMMLSNVMIFQYANEETHQIPNNTRTAFAIREGMIEMCLRFVKMFGGHELFDDDESSLYNVSLYKYIRAVLTLIHKVSLHTKSAKAIRSKRSSIEEGLVHLEEDERMKNDPNCRVLLDKVRSTLDINGSYCCRCNKSLCKTEVMECNGCNRMTYCSRACQKEDWLSGHNVTCKKLSSQIQDTSLEPAVVKLLEIKKNQGIIGWYQGRVWPIEAPKNTKTAQVMEGVERNMTMIQLKLFYDNAETILNHADVLDLPLYDCVVLFDLRCCPVEVEVKKYTDHYSTVESKKGFEESRSKANITCMYDSFVYSNEELDEDGAPSISVQRLYPHEWLSISRGDQVRGMSK